MPEIVLPPLAGLPRETHLQMERYKTNLREYTIEAINGFITSHKEEMQKHQDAYDAMAPGLLASTEAHMIKAKYLSEHLSILCCEQEKERRILKPTTKQNKPGL